MERLPVAGVQAVGGGMAGLGQDFWTDPSVFDWGWTDPGGYVDPGVFVWGGGGGGGGGSMGDWIAPSVYDPGAPVEVFQPPEGGGYYPTAYDYGASSGVSVDPNTGSLTFEGYIYDPPGVASVAVDPGWTQDAEGRYYWSYADGSRSYLDGTTIWSDGSYSTPDGYLISPAIGQVTDPAGGVTQSLASLPSALQAIGAAGSSLLNFARGIVGIWTGAATPPPGTRAGQTYRASNGQYYRLNADGTSTLVASPTAAQRAGAGLLGGMSGTGLLLLGGGPWRSLPFHGAAGRSPWPRGR